MLTGRQLRPRSQETGDNGDPGARSLVTITLTMAPARLRESLFPNIPPYLTFIGLDER